MSPAVGSEEDHSGTVDTDEHTWNIGRLCIRLRRTCPVRTNVERRMRFDDVVVGVVNSLMPLTGESVGCRSLLFRDYPTSFDFIVRRASRPVGVRFHKMRTVGATTTAAKRRAMAWPSRVRRLSRGRSYDRATLKYPQ